MAKATDEQVKRAVERAWEGGWRILEAAREVAEKRAAAFSFDPNK